MNETGIAQIIERFNEKKILVIGDLMLDVYVKGKSSRLSPEAPVPVVDVEEKQIILGGSANVVCNLKAMGARVIYISVIGDDDLGSKAIELLKSNGINSNFVYRDQARVTMVKTRVVAGAHVITRFDEGTAEPVSAETAMKLSELIKIYFKEVDGVIISDYDKGTISNELLKTLEQLQSECPKSLSIDSKRLPFFKSLKPTMVKPNYDEGVKLIQATPKFSARLQQMADKGARLLEETASKIVTLTMDELGAMVFHNGQLMSQVNAGHSPMPHVSGAGDTYLAAFMLSFVSGASLDQCNRIAIGASTVSISKQSTSTCSKAELRRYLSCSEKAIDDRYELSEICDAYRQSGKKIVFTNGCFDILHSGHVTYLQCAKSLGDVLIVGINNDRSIQRIKGKSRPVNQLEDRIEVLSALSCIDHVIAFGKEGDDTPIDLILTIKPEVFVKGGDYSLDQLPEATVVTELGGEIVLIPPVPDHSTTLIIKKINQFIEPL